MGHWNRDRDREPAQLTGCLLGGKLPPCRVPSTEPRFGCQPLPGRGFISKVPLDRGVAQAVRNNSAPPKWSKLWTDDPKPGDRIGAYTPEQFEQMNQEFTAAVERAFSSGGESFFAASRTYDVRRRRSRIAGGGSEHF